MYKFLYIEDNAEDAYLFDLMVKGTGSVPPICTLTHVETLDDGLAMLETKKFDGAIVDLTLPDSKGLATLECVTLARPDIPVIVLTSSDNDALAVGALAGGAQDYLVKDDVTLTTLTRSIRHSIERKRLDQELLARNAELEAALAEVKRLQGMIRICCVCKRVANDRGRWQEIEVYFREYSDARFTHGYCPDCAQDVERQRGKYVRS